MYNETSLINKVINLYKKDKQRRMIATESKETYERGN